jgi:hypothetical protein
LVCNAKTPFLLLQRIVTRNVKNVAFESKADLLAYLKAPLKRPLCASAVIQVVKNWGSAMQSVDRVGEYLWGQDLWSGDVQETPTGILLLA